jgi:uncharacterized membrane-anchored protein
MGFFMSRRSGWAAPDMQARHRHPLHGATGWLGWEKPEDVSKAGVAGLAMQAPADHAAGQRHERGWTATDDCVRGMPEGAVRALR